MLTIEAHAGVSVLRLEHGKVNALDVEIFDALRDVLDELERDGGCRALVLTGAGPVFSAGVDLHRVVEGGEQYVDALLSRLSATLRKLFLFPRPVVAAINGHAIAGGYVLACASDYRLMARGPGKLGLLELKVGVPFPTAAIEIVRFAVPREHLQEVIYTGRRYDVEEARRRGLLDEIVEPESLLERALEIARGLGAVPAETFSLTKAQLRRPSAHRLDRDAQLFEPAVERIWRSGHTIGAIRAYLAETLRKN